MSFDDPTFWQRIGISIQDLTAGFAGGLVKALMFGKAEPLPIVISVIIGALTANYLAPTIGHYLGTQGGAAGFVTGLAGMALCQGIVDAAKGWRPFQPKGNPDA